MRLLEGQVCVVTGGGRGIGAAICEAFAREGAEVAIGYGRDAASAEATLGRIRAAGGRAEAVALDVRSPEAGSVIEALASRHGRLDVLVNNAGITRDKLLLSMTDEEWREVLDVNLDGAMRCTRAAARAMLEQHRGSIINVSSGAARSPHPGQANYAASKGALEAFTRALAVELGGKGIRVNALAPGFIRTGMSAPVLKKSEAAVLGKVPLRRIGAPEEVADAALFLASELSRYVTGHVLAVDGGITL